MGVGARIPLGGAIDGISNGRLRNAFVVVPENLPKGFELPSGHVNLLTLVGITDKEFAAGRAEGGDVLAARLRSTSTFPVTVP
ncbi:suppressor of fused domain protein [Asticcacaulis benevestitus]|uniref:suppressor of fused domain protein n=1 Tax=Asticcacaulis benevestitus TaxID=347481 RepID=UPI0009DA00A0